MRAIVSKWGNSLALVCPITSQAKGYPFQVPISTTGRRAGVILADQVESLDWQARNAEALTKAPASVVTRTLALVRTLP